jgi:arylsulfatase A-like enzyme
MKATWVVWLAVLGACAPDAARFRIRPDEPRLAGRSAWLAGPPVTPRQRVNVVLIVADDLGRADVSTYPEGRVETPNLDRLARAGVTYEAGYVTAALCSPSRAALLTGRSQQRFGHEGQPHDRYARSGLEYLWMKTFMATDDWRVLRWSAPDEADVQRQGLPASELTLAELLKRAGYATGMFGKWHLGWAPEFQPHRRGFDDFYGFYEAYSLYAAPTDRADIVEQHLDEFSDRFIWGRGRGDISAVVRNGVPTEEPGYLTDRFTDEAIAFIDRHRAEPFFLYVPYQNPHTPFQVKRSDHDRFPHEKDPVRRAYLALISSLDQSVGRLLDALEERGLAEDTLVIFLSDNGGALYTRATSNAPFQGGKFTLFEGGLRVPYTMRWPGHIPAGLRYAEPVSSLDVVATVAGAVGLPLPADRPYDGVDLLPFLRGERAGSPHRALHWRAGYTSAVRQGSLKLIRDRQAGLTALFDLARDPGEQHDLAASRPGDVKALEASLDAWGGECREPLWPAVMDYRFVADDGRAWWYPL